MAVPAKRFRQALRMAGEMQLRAARRETIEVVALQIFDAVVLAGQLLAVQRVLAELAGSGEPEFADFVPGLVVLTACYALRGVAAAWVRERRIVIGETVQRDVALRVLSVAGRADVATFESPAFHDRLRRIDDQTYQGVWSVVWAMVNLGSQLFVSLSMVWLLASVSPLTLLVCLAGLVPFAVTNRFRNRMQYELTVEQTTRDRERSYLEELLLERRNVPELRSLDLGEHLIDRVRRLYELRIRDVRASSKRRARVAGVGGLVSSVMAGAALAVLLAVTVSGDLGIAKAGVAVLALQQLLNQLRGLVDVVGEIDGAVPFLEDFRVFEEELGGSSSVPANAAPLAPLEELRLDAVSFTYPGTAVEVLHAVDATIVRGEVIALVGHNGSGKTTLAKLLAGLYEPTSGRITWNGTDRSDFPTDAVRASVGVVFQDFLRYELPMRDNVGFGDVRRLDDHPGIDDALRRAGASEIVGRLPFGADTRLSRSYEDGVELSGGQWQRLALARAFFRDAELLVLDEPSAALDPLAERALFEDLRELCLGRTVIMISHRFSTVRSADRILVLDSGRLVEQGSHEALMALGGRYAHLFEMQAAPYAG